MLSPYSRHRSQRSLHERQMDGIHKAKAKGIHFGAQPKLTDEQIAELRQRRQNGDLIRELMKDYRISKATVYRYLVPTS
ncbi:MAG: Hin recombinase [Anaerolineae bacterium]|nr:Hin recombinase [Anaerolineae bacterium]